MIKLGVLMDPIAQIKIHKDSTFAMLLAAQARQWSLWYMEQSDVFLRDGECWATMRELTVESNASGWFRFGQTKTVLLSELNVLLMRKDPPFNQEYIYTTYLLEHAERRGVFVVNKPQSLRDANEKIFTSWFPHCCPPTLVTRNMRVIEDFIDEQQDVILKPLDGMAGASIFRVQTGDANRHVIVETLSDRGHRSIMAQRYLPEIRDGDKRILLIDGEPIPYALARIPAVGETRGNLAAGGTPRPQPLSDRDYWLCRQVGPTLRAKGLLFVGLDVIGDYITEINVTSPTCIRELEAAYSIPIADQLLACIEKKLISSDPLPNPPP